jgi:hypothetical protein
MLPSRYPSTVIAVLALLLVCTPTSLGQQRLWQSLRHESLAEFSWDCAQTSWRRTARLNGLVQTALHRSDDGPPKYGDRAFAFDLNGDGRAEMFVPLTCGATGNCSWAILTTRHPRLLGVVGGESLYLHRKHGGWPVIITYVHVTAGEGSLMTYRVQRGRYVAVAKPYAINHTDYDMDVQRGRGNKMPLFLERAREACGTVGY